MGIRDVIFTALEDDCWPVEDAEHIADLLETVLMPYAVVELPDPTPDAYGRPSWSVPSLSGESSRCVIHIDCDRIVPGYGSLNGSAYGIASALLAADRIVRPHGGDT